MTKQQQVIYIPGFGDSRPWGQPTILKLWRVWGCEVHYSPVNWDNNEPFEQKLTKLLELIDKLTSSGRTISLVGISAGATMAMNVYAARNNQIHRVVFICGKLLYPETVSESYFKIHPAFRKSVFGADTNFKKLDKADKAKMLSMFALADNTVPVRASKLPGVRWKRILALGHILAFYIAISFYSRSVCKFLKS